MKKTITLILTLALCFTLWTPPALAAGSSYEAILSETRIDFEDGSYCIEIVKELHTNARSSEKSGSKTATYYSSSGEDIFSITVSGTFTYDGSSAEATSSEATVHIFDSSATFVRKTSSYSGSTAKATGTVRYSSSDITKTVSLKCSATGVLS